VFKLRGEHLSSKCSPLLRSPSDVFLVKDSILQRIASGDKVAVDDCLNRYGGLIWSLAKRWLGNVPDAEDATQEIFVELWQQAGKYDPAVAGEATFVAMVARRRLIDRMRKESRRPITEVIVNEPMDDSRSEGLAAVEWADDVARVKQCLSRLTAVQQKILNLAVHHGASHSVISDRLSMPLGTVKSYARRGLIQLRDCMKLHGELGALSPSLQTLEPQGGR
jgi:RNA polymerase sigma factor (sigma-70 family)